MEARAAREGERGAGGRAAGLAARRSSRWR